MSSNKSKIITFDCDLIKKIKKNKKISINTDTSTNLVVYRTKPKNKIIYACAIIIKINNKIGCYEGVFESMPENPYVLMPVFTEGKYKFCELETKNINLIYDVICDYLQI